MRDLSRRLAALEGGEHGPVTFWVLTGEASPFSSGSAGANLLLTSALYDDPTDGATVLHIAVPLKTPGVMVLDNCRTMAMRASGSNDIVVIRKKIAAQAMLAVVEKALETVRGGGIFRSMGLERLVRDMHAAQFHPMQPKRQQRFTGRAALGLDPAG